MFRPAARFLAAVILPPLLFFAILKSPPLISGLPLNARACRVVAGRAGEALGLPLVNRLGRTRPKAHYDVHRALHNYSRSVC